MLNRNRNEYGGSATIYDETMAALTYANGAVSAHLESQLKPIIEYFFNTTDPREGLIRNPDIQQNDHFTYKSLSPGQIRVLYILPGIPGRPIECILAPAGFRDGGAYFEQLIWTKDKKGARLVHNRDQHGKPMYSALSYVWGDPTATEIVFVNCCPFPVTRNLYEALKAIRGETNTYTFWTDAICINQKDDDEKSHQISLMKKIYESATLIIAFLGESTKHTDDALEAIKRVHGRFHPDPDQLRANPEDFVAHSDFNPRSEFGDSALLGLKDICNRPYWTRVWIQQEFSTSTNTIVRCGEKTVAKMQLLSVCGLLLQYQMGTSRMIDERMNPGAVANYIVADDRQNRVGLKDLGATYFMECLHLSRHFFASDIRDKVFAVLPWLSENYFQARGGPPYRITPNYRSSAAQIYGKLAFWCIRTDQNLDALGYVDHENFVLPNVRLSLATWVPQWSCASLRQPFIKWLRLENDNPRRAYSASGDFQWDSGLHVGFKFGEVRGENALGCAGFRLDRIVKVTEPQNDNVDLDVSIERSWAPENPDDIYEYTGETMRTAYLRTIHADMKSYSNNPYLAIERGFPSHYDPFRNDPILSKDRELLKPASRGRRLAYTRGGLIALVPSIAQEDHEIFILKNGSVAYVLEETRKVARADEVVIGEDPNNGVRIIRRDCEEGTILRFSEIAYSFVFLGEAYVHGFMDGEALQLLNGPIGGLLDQCWEEIKII